MLRTIALLSALVLLPLLLLGCPAAVEADGIWYFVWEAPEPPICTESVDENYLDGAIPPPEDLPENPWTFTDDGAVSSGSFFGQIVTLEGGTPLLIIDDSVLEGAGDALEWTFSWDAFEQDGETQAHDAGYRYSELTYDSASTVITMTISGAAATGTMTNSEVFEESWTETDEWDAAEVGVAYSKIPSGTWLFDGDGLPVENVPPSVDCQGVNCQLAFTTDCRSAAPFTATQTTYTDEDVFDAVEDAGQPFGLGN